MMNNIPKVKVGLVAVSRDCFPESLSVNRRKALVEAFQNKYDIEDIYECLICIVESEIHMIQALKDIKEAGCNALCVYLGNFGPEISETLLAKHFDGPKMFLAAAEETQNDLVQGRGDAEDCADMLHEFLPVARAIIGLSELKIISFGPRPLNFLACNAPIKQLYNLGVEIEENSELDLFEAFNRHEGDEHMELPRRGLVIVTWGNVSAIDRETGYVVIKPSGVDYNTLKPEDMVVLDLDGNKIEGTLNPSSDTPTHLELYKKYKEIGGITHTHSTEAVAWAQAGKDIPLYGTTHADYMFGDIPCTRNLTDEEINEAYEKNIGKVIIETFENRNINPLYVPAILCKNHGSFTFGEDAMESVHNAIILEEIAKMARYTENLHPNCRAAPINIKEKHFYRKHGENAYYGQ